MAEDPDKLNRVVDARMKLKARFEEKMRQTERSIILLPLIGKGSWRSRRKGLFQYGLPLAK